jgi:hypothetical protein
MMRNESSRSSADSTCVTSHRRVKAALVYLAAQR